MELLEKTWEKQGLGQHELSIPFQHKALARESWRGRVKLAWTSVGLGITSPCTDVSTLVLLNLQFVRSGRGLSLLGSALGVY